MPLDRSQFLTAAQVGQALAKSPDTIRRWCRDKRLEAMGIETFQDPGGQWLIHQDVINKPSPK